MGTRWSFRAMKYPTIEITTRTAAIQIKDLEQSLELYKLDVGRYPTTDQGLQALVVEPDWALQDRLGLVPLLVRAGARAGMRRRRGR